MATTVAQQYRRVAVNAVRPHPDNPRRGDLDRIGDSIDANGFYGALVVQRSTGYILAGNHRWAAAKRQGLDRLPAIYVDVDDETAKRILLVDNRTAELAGWDAEQLAAVLESFGADTAGTGFSLEEAMDAIASGHRRRDGNTDPDEVPPLPRKAKAKTGEVWKLGRHRLAVGDATDPGMWSALFWGEEQADLVFTDPPYGIGYVGKTAEALTLEGDRRSDPAATAKLLGDAFDQTLLRCRPGAVWYVCAPAGGPAFLPFALTLHERQLWRQTIVWVKDAMVLGHADYHARHEVLLGSEPLCYGWKPGAAHTASPDRTQDSVWEFDRPKASRDHPTMKPIALVEKAIENSAREAGIVADPFAGSGTTLLACERTGRTARCIEIDPRYADVIVTRWAEFTGETPKKV